MTHANIKLNLVFFSFAVQFVNMPKTNRTKREQKCHVMLSQPEMPAGPAMLHSSQGSVLLKPTTNGPLDWPAMPQSSQGSVLQKPTTN